jgi:lysophospholipase L1-like esterase
MNERAETRQALRHLALAALSCALVAALSYASPAFERFRPWVGGEGVPIVRMFQSGAALPEFAEAVGVSSDVTGGASDEDLGTAVAATLKQSARTPTPEPEPEGPTLRIDPKEYADISQRIDNPKALDKFFKQLARTARKEKGAVTRVAHYGDSAVAADEITQTVRRRLQKRFGDAGHGFILMSRGKMHYVHRDVRHRSNDAWQAYSVVHRGLRGGWYGYGGVQFRTEPGAHASFGTTDDDAPVGQRVSRFELFYQRHRGGGRVKLRVDREKKRRILETRGDEQEDAWELIKVPDGAHTLTVSAASGSPARLYGVALDRDGPGVVIDSLGLVGARAERLLHIERKHLARQISHRAPHLVVLGFGGNELANAWLSLERYEEDLRRVVDHVRSTYDGMSCLLFGPLDQGLRDNRGRVVTKPKLPDVVAIQRKVAIEKGCAFYDTFAAMGGQDAVATWYRSRPRLLTSDLVHATPLGYDVIGTMYSKAILQAFAQWLDKRK